jgi:hypothetical protein
MGNPDYVLELLETGSEGIDPILQCVCVWVHSRIIDVNIHHMPNQDMTSKFKMPKFGYFQILAIVDEYNKTRRYFRAIHGALEQNRRGN